jgi:hypothetical protein
VRKAIVLNTCSIVGKVLNDEIHLCDEETNNPNSFHFTMFLALHMHFNIP